MLAEQDALVVERGARPARQGAELWRVLAERRLGLDRVLEHPRPERIADGEGPEPLGQREPRLARLAVPGGDDHHTVGGERPVDRRGGGALENRDVVDVGRVQVREAVHRVVLIAGVAARLRRRDRVHAVGDRVVAHDQAVHHDQRIDTGVDRRHAAQLDLAPAPRRARVQLDEGARHLALERALERGGRGPVQLFGADRRDGIGQVALLHRRGLAGDDHGLEVKHVLLETDVDARLIRRDGHLAVPEPDAPNLQRHGARRRGEREFPAPVRDGRNRGAQHRNGGAGNRLRRRRAVDLAGDGALLSERGGDADAEAQRD